MSEAKRARITVAVATAGRPEALARCLDALAAGRVLPAEVLVVDQAGDEGTRAVVEDRGAVHIRQDRLGLSASRNLAKDRATCPVVAVTDDDCVPESGWVAAIQGAFAAPTPPAAVTGPVLPLGPDAPGSYAVASRTSRVRREFGPRDVPWLVGTGANFAVDRRWLGQVGGYDERLGVGSRGRAGEDIDLFYRLLRAGGRIVYEPDAIVLHERQSISRRTETRSSYGHGIGAFCALRFRQRDLRAAPILGRWLGLRTRLLVASLIRLRWCSVREELLVLAGTLRGLLS